MILQKVQNYIHEHALLTPDQPVVVGVSGGTDSMVLLHVLMSLGYSCLVAHCNFHLRSEESDRDEAFVRNLCLRYQLPFYHVDFQTTEYASQQGVSIEMAARELRYRWFEELRYQHGAQAVAVAHHADDSIETLLLNLIRGTGLRGLTGIAPRNKDVVRPLLCCSRTELENYLVEHELNHVEDSTNALSDYRRNKIRNQVLPLLEEINPSVRQTLYETTVRLKGTLGIYEQAINDIALQAISTENDTVLLDIATIERQTDTSTVLYELLSPYGFHPDTIEQIREQLHGEPGKVFYADSYRLIKDRHKLVITSSEVAPFEEIIVPSANTTVFLPAPLTLSAKIVGRHFSVSKEKNRIHVDAALLRFPLTVRAWREGDVFCPFGMKGKKKLSDFFSDQKLSLADKEQVRLLVSGNDIVWVIGYRVDNRFRVTEKTIEAVEVQLIINNS